MTPKELVLLLGVQTYPLDLSAPLLAQARAAGLVVVHGASDDLMVFQGAIEDEAGCYGGGGVKVDAKGPLPDFENLDAEDKAELRDYFKRETEAVALQALWGEEPGYSWTYKTAIPHETFEIIEDGAPYCRGIVFALTDLATVTAGERKC